ASGGCTTSGVTTGAPWSTSSVRSSSPATTPRWRSIWGTPTAAPGTPRTRCASTATRSRARRNPPRWAGSRARSTSWKAVSGRRARRSEPAPGARPRSRARWAAAVLVGLLSLAGCLPGMRRPRPLPPATAAGLLEELSARRTAVQSLRARARLRAGLKGMWVREAFLVRRPTSVRIDVLSPFGLALAVGTDGTLLWAYPAGEGTRYEGAATPANLARFLGAPASVPEAAEPNAAVDAALFAPPPAGRVVPLEAAVTRP